ncbi:MAG: NADH-dependent [FeFe] hydrogenase, group A6 [Marinilabiliaceae bacterium]|nr:NADH-dependent [FeFe] hydrogenase, group A6 [Marinilabiliaceae bacterium]
MIQLTINNKKISAEPGTTILEAAKQNGINIPSLCYLEGVHKFGSCRICSVEVENARTLQVACMAEVREGMVVHTNSKKVLKTRKVLYELMLSDHSKNCLSCVRNQSCELQQLGEILCITENRFNTGSAREQIDISPSITRDLSKCIFCRRCITACKEIQGIGILDAQYRGFDSVIAPPMDHSINDAKCSFCGQCTVVCPVGALSETDHIKKVWNAINDPEIRVVMQPAPAIRVALGEMFGYPVGTSVTGKMAAAIRALGVDDVFDTDWAADLTIMEEGTEFLHRAIDVLSGKDAVLPIITSCSPGWIKYVESYFPQLIPHLSTCKSPHMMLGALSKTYHAEKIGVDPRKIFTVSIMPCTAKKFECSREEMINRGVPNVDAVLTTRELGQMIKQAGIDFPNLEDEDFDDPMGQSTGAADIFGVTGGVMEAAIRTVYAIITGRDLPFEQLHVTPIVGLDQIKEATLKFENVVPEYKMFEGFEAKVAVTSGLAGAKILMDQIVYGKSPYHFIEVMGCPSGCICGGGQPRSHDPDVRIKRLKAIYGEDEGKKLRQSHHNPSIAAIYKDYLGKPGGHLSHELLHTHYFDRSKENEK